VTDLLLKTPPEKLPNLRNIELSGLQHDRDIKCAPSFLSKYHTTLMKKPCLITQMTGNYSSNSTGILPRLEGK